MPVLGDHIFQSTLPRRERLGVFPSSSRSSNFNPRSREGSDVNLDADDKDWVISIHAPAKGATLLAVMPSLNVLFQSTLPRRERPGRSFCPIMLCFISIHAPAKGATMCSRYSRYQSGNISIHAPAKGATADMQAYVQKCRFQSTLPRRERRSTWFRGLKTGYFNPRSREGSDIHSLHHRLL